MNSLWLFLAKERLRRLACKVFGHPMGPFSDVGYRDVRARWCKRCHLTEFEP